MVLMVVTLLYPHAKAKVIGKKYLEVLADDLLRILAHRTLRGASHVKKVPSSSLQHYIAAALLGFILILLLIILTVGI